jgi:hypothetical protein
VRRSLLSVPYPSRFLFASHPDLMGRMLDTVYRSTTPNLIKEAGFPPETAQAWVVTLIQRFGRALNLNVRFQRVSIHTGLSLPSAAQGRVEPLGRIRCKAS